MKKITALIIIIFLLLGLLFAKKYREKDYRDEFNKWIHGKVEFVLSDKSRVDILTDIYAIEVDWAEKFKEAIGQSLYYSVMTEKKPGIVLIMKSKKDNKYLKSLLKVCNKYNIQVWIINSDFTIKKINGYPYKNKP